MRIAPLIAASLVAVLDLQAQRVSTGQVQYAVEQVIVSASEFTLESVLELCRKRIRDQRPEFLNVWFFRSPTDASTYQSGTLTVHPTYEMWRSAYEAISALSMPVAELILVGDSAVLLFRGADQRFGRYVLRGSDPLKIGLPQGSVSLSHFAVMPASSEGAERRVEAFGWTDVALTDAIGLEVLREVRTRLPFREASVSLRRDPWFIDNPFYPVAPLIPTEIRPPSQREFSTSHTLTCGGTVNKEPRCTLFTVHP